MWFVDYRFSTDRTFRAIPSYLEIRFKVEPTLTNASTAWPEIPRHTYPLRREAAIFVLILRTEKTFNQQNDVSRESVSAARTRC